MINQRRSDRFDLDIPSRLTVIAEHDEQSGETIEISTKNVCEGGAYFHTLSPLPMGTRVSVDMLIAIKSLKGLDPNKSLIHVNGFISRCESEGMAVCFDKDYQITPFETAANG